MDSADAKVLSTKLEVLHTDVGEIKDALKTLSEAITKLALVEERQSQTAQAVERAFVAIEKCEVRLERLEHIATNANRTSRWVDRAVWAGAAAAFIFVAKQAKLL